MRWSPGRDSGNVEDRRGSSGIGMSPMGIGGTVILLVLSLIFGRDLVTGSGDETPAPPAAGCDVTSASESPAEAKNGQLVKFVFDTAQATWSKVLSQAGAPWHDAKLVLF